MNDAAIRSVLDLKKSKADASKAEIDHAHIDKEMQRPGVTMMLLCTEGFFNMKEESWVEAHVHAPSFFGSCTPGIVKYRLSL